MGFVNVYRFIDEQNKWFKNLSEEEKQEESRNLHADYDIEQEEPIINSRTYDLVFDPDEELPF